MEDKKGGVKRIISFNVDDIKKYCKKCANTGLIKCFDYGEGYEYFRDCECKNETKIEWL